MLVMFFFPTLLAENSSFTYSPLAHAALLSDLVWLHRPLCFVRRVKLNIIELLLGVTIQGSTLWMVGSCALQLGPQTIHPAAP